MGSTENTKAEADFSSLMARIERREQQARRNAVLYTIVPVVMAAVLLGYTGYRVKQATIREAMLEKQVADLQTKLAEAANLSRYVKPIDPVDMKMIFSEFPRAARVLELIMSLRERGVKWKLGGRSPEEGFDSPGFAAFVLRTLNLPGSDVKPGETLIESSRRLFERLPATPNPGVGDLVFYPAGYALFYFLDQRHQPFVIGMTPFGITALYPNFAPVVGYRRVQP